MSVRTRARAGTYNHLITLLHQNVTQDEFGQEKRSWDEGQPIYAAKEAEYRPTDSFIEMSAAHHYEQRLWFRTRKGVAFHQTAMRLRDPEDGDYEILAIEPDTVNREVRLLCRLVKP